MILLFFLLVYGLGLVNAFAAYGAYERVYFYYAYLIDAHMAIDSGGKKPVTIAKGFRGEMPCTFNQFVDYINESTGLSFTNHKYPDVDTTAKALIISGLTGVYQPLRIIERISREHPVPSLFKEISKVLLSRAAQGALDKYGDYFDKAEKSMKRVLWLRTWAYQHALRDALNNARNRDNSSRFMVYDYPEPQRLYDGDSQVYIFIDDARTAADKANIENGIEKFVRTWKRRNSQISHLNNIQAAKDAVIFFERIRENFRSRRLFSC